jgi:hypothetical protein
MERGAKEWCDLRNLGNGEILSIILIIKTKYLEVFGVWSGENPI